MRLSRTVTLAALVVLGQLTSSQAAIAGPVSASVTAADGAPTVDAVTVPDPVVGQPYSFAFSASGSPTPTWQLTSGTLPGGVTLSSAGVLSGTPTTSAVSSFIVTATNSLGSAASAPVQVQTRFSDVAANQTFAPDVYWMTNQGLTTGFAGGTFRPDQIVTRQAFAAFLYRYSHQGTAGGACAAGTSSFSDVPDSSPFCKDSAWLASNHITGGFADGTFRPAQTVARQAVAAFFYRFNHGGADAGPCSSASAFADVPTSSQFCGDIAWLAQTTPEAVTTGFPDGTFKPAGGATRQAISAYFHRYDNDFPTALSVTTGSLPDATGGVAYLQALTAANGVEPITWSASGLPDGLSLSPEGAITGYPNAVGSSSISVLATDAAGRTAQKSLALQVATSLPPSCTAGTCSIVAPNGQTTDVPASAIVSIGRDSNGLVNQVVVNGVKADVGSALNLAPIPDVPTGIVVVVQSLTNNADGTSTLSVAPGSPTDAFASGTIQGVGLPVDTVASGTGSTSSPALRRAPGTAQSLGVSCTGDASASASLSVKPSLTPSMTALWKHPLFGGGGFYVGTGGLQLFQFDLQGQIKVAVTASVSAAAHCSLSLPTLKTSVPAGALGAVILQLAPKVSLDVSGKATVSASVTMTCNVEYRWSNGASYPVHYCVPSYQAPQLSSDTGVDATVTAGLDASVTVDDIAGITGSISASLHAGFHPNQTPNGILDVSVDYNLGACLACFWKDSPAKVTIVSGTIYKKTLATYNFPVSNSGGSSGGSPTTVSSPVSGSSGSSSYGSGTGSSNGSVVGASYDGSGMAETTGGVVRTWSDYTNGGGSQGPSIGSYNMVGIACRVSGLVVADGNPWWYQIANSPWGGSYYASADAFYNNGETGGSLANTPFFDPSVPLCGGGGSGSGVGETAGGVAHTWTDASSAGGAQGPNVASGQTVLISCRLTGFTVGDGNNWWYRISSAPWTDSYYVSADAFYNNGAKSGSLAGTPFVDSAVPGCTPPSSGGSSGGTGGTAPPGTTLSETTGGVTHTWTNYTNAGGTQGPNIASNQTVYISCRLNGFQVADGNTWWYRISSSPWSDTFFASADAFYNNGQTSGSLTGTPFVDTNVPVCTSSSGGGGGQTGTAETAGGVTHTWTNYTNAGGTQGPNVASGQTVLIECRLTGFQVADGNTWWYRIASSPWSSQYYASADAFYNNGQTSGSLAGTPFVDTNVAVCSAGGGGAPPPPTYAETTGGVTHTWTNYTNAGGTQGPSIGSNATVQISCKLTGFQVADGNTWWYRIASDPWSNQYYASADAFYNNGQTSGSLQGTPFVDNNVPNC